MSKLSKLSKSPDRHRFQDATGRYASEIRPDITDDTRDMWNRLRTDMEDLERDPKWAEHNLEYDLRTSEDMCERVRDAIYAQNLYAALCNNAWRRDDDVQRKLTGETWSCSWRHAGGILADMRGDGDYIDWYMSGMDPFGDGMAEGSVTEGTVTDQIRADIHALGWSQVDDPRVK